MENTRLNTDNLTLVINAGSSSVKFALFASRPQQPLDNILSGTLEGFSGAPAVDLHPTPQLPISDSLRQMAANLRFTNAEQAQCALADWLGAFSPALPVQRIGYRVVHGGEQFSGPTRLNAAVIEQLDALTSLAPLHQPPAIQGIRLFMARYPQAEHTACFDTAFHATLPPLARTFAIPQRFTEQGIRPYGFHGLSYQSVVEQLRGRLDNPLPERMVIAHLGSGASLCAVHRGQSIATTMSFSPLDGLPMSTRCGALDPAAVLYMTSELQLSGAEVFQVLNKQSGLLGLSGISGDIRQLQASPEPGARFALDFYAYRIACELGGMVSALQGLDALVFTGGAGAHNPPLRQAIAERCGWLGIELEPQANAANELLLSTTASPIPVYQITTDEERVIAQSCHLEPSYSSPRMNTAHWRSS